MATAASMGKPNSRAASLSAWAAAEPGGIRSDSPPEVAFSGAQEHDGQHHRGGPGADDEVTQADHDKCVTAGQDACDLLL